MTTPTGIPVEVLTGELSTLPPAAELVGNPVKLFTGILAEGVEAEGEPVELSIGILAEGTELEGIPVALSAGILAEGVEPVFTVPVFTVPVVAAPVVTVPVFPEPVDEPAAPATPLASAGIESASNIRPGATNLSFSMLFLSWLGVNISAEIMQTA